MKPVLKIFLAVLLPVLIVSGCEKDYGRDPRRSKVTPDLGQVISCTENVHLTLDQVKAIVGDPELCSRLKYGITCYNVRYQTTYTDDRVEAEALLSVPDYAEGETPKYATYFHGTLLPFKLNVIDTSTPSSFKGTTKSKDIMFCALPLAAAGYCVITPDYTGYGPTKGMDHPFIYYPELYKSAIDGVKAGYNALTDNLNVKLPDKKIWLTGWSQGGGLSLFFQREQEKMQKPNFEIIANSTLAGPFNITHFMQSMMDEPDKTYLALALYSWAAYAIDIFDVEMWRPLDQIFRPEIYDQMSAILLMSNTPGELFQDFFMQKIRSGEDEAFIDAMNRTSTSSGWTPNAPVYMHHGNADNLVPYFNMTDAYEGLKGSGKMHMFTKDGGGHDTFVPEYMSHTIDVFKEIQ